MKGAIAHRNRDANSKKAAKMDHWRSNHGQSSTSEVGGLSNNDNNHDSRGLSTPVLQLSSSNDIETLDDIDHFQTDHGDHGSNVNLLRAFGPLQNWDNIVSRMLKHGYWSRLGDLAMNLNTVPPDIEAIFDRLQKKLSSNVDKDTRLQWYKEFIRTGLGSSVLRFAEVEALIKRMNLSSHIGENELHILMDSKLEQTHKGVDHSEFFDFELFASLICDLVESKTKLNQVLFDVSDLFLAFL